MQRRTFIKVSAVGGIAAGVAVAGYVGLSAKRDGRVLTIQYALDKIDALRNQKVTTRGEWSGFRIFNHIAQSIEFSLSGYPEQKSAVFQNTVGALAFSIFSTRGAMRHGLAEPIPGAPALEESGDILQALDRLKNAFITFDNHSGELAPHFAYGRLTKEEYAAAHVMHFNNHLDEIVV